MSYGLIGVAAAAIAAASCMPARTRRMLHLLQLEHYENARLFHWLRRRGEIADRSMVVAIVLAVVAVGAASAHAPLVELVAGLAAAATLAPGLRPAPRAEIKPLVWTERARRVFVATLAVPAVVPLVGIVVTVARSEEHTSELQSQ